MTAQLFLIAHSVRDEAAFDVAAKMECPHCHGVGCARLHPEDTYEGPSCLECDSLGYWWIIPTSGHRAFPYWYTEINELMYAAGMIVDKPMPSGWPDHYRVGPTPTLNIMSLFKAQREAKPHIPRRL